MSDSSWNDLPAIPFFLYKRLSASLSLLGNSQSKQKVFVAFLLLSLVHFDFLMFFNLFEIVGQSSKASINSTQLFHHLYQSESLVDFLYYTRDSTLHMWTVRDNRSREKRSITLCLKFILNSKADPIFRLNSIPDWKSVFVGCDVVTYFDILSVWHVCEYIYIHVIFCLFDISLNKFCKQN